MNRLLFTISVFSCVVSNILGYPVHNSHHDEGSANIDYSVQDIHTGDVKQHYEVRDKHFVLGTYSLAEPDGTYRIVEYEAYPHKGFKAVVKRIGKAHHPQVYHNGEEHHKNEEHTNIHFNEVGKHLGEAESHINLDSDIGEHFGKIDGYVGDDNEIGKHYGEAESHVGVTHWGHQ